MDHLSADADAWDGDVMGERLFVLSMYLVAIETAAVADGGAVLFRQSTERWLVTMFASSTPVAEGPVDLSVLVQNAASLEPLLDGKVSFVLIPPDSGSAIAGFARREKSQNKLVYSLPVAFDRSGMWRVKVRIAAREAEEEASAFVNVAPTPPTWRIYWPYVAAPLFVIVLFVTREALVQRRMEKAA